LPFRILIADDHDVVRRMLRITLEEHKGWEVCGEASNGLEAIQSAAVLKPDLVILDLAMPVMDGLRAAREISLAAPQLPIVMHTNHGSEGVEIEAKKNGVRWVLSKGGDANEFMRVIEELLASDNGVAAGLSAGGPLDLAKATEADGADPKDGSEKE
jgi:DNA-binding NarL/FixJ family response regulator